MVYEKLEKLRTSQIINEAEYEAGITFIKLTNHSNKYLHSKQTIHNHRYEKAHKLFQMILRHSNSRQVLLDLTNRKSPYRSYSELQLLKHSLGDVSRFLREKRRK